MNKHIICMQWLQKLPKFNLFLRNTEQYNNLSHNSFKIVPLCNYRLLPESVNVLDSFLETILSKPFQLLHRILNYIT